MKKLIIVSFLTISMLLSISCHGMMRYSHQSAENTKKRFNYPDELHYKIAVYKEYAQKKLKPVFHAAHLHYPPKKIALLVFKQSKRMELWAKGKGRQWRHIRNYRILAASGHSGPKLKNMDKQVPEGIYHIAGLNPHSHFHLSMKVNYPNAFDRREALQDHRKNLGGDIFIHGSNRSIGCVAIGDRNIDQIFVLSYLVGIKNIKVIIAPNDLRKEKANYVRSDPPWVNHLYTRIKKALAPFKV